MDWLYLITHTDILTAPTRVLHIAPEVCLEAPLRALPNVDYLSGDYDSSLAMEAMDITDIKHPAETFDAVICNHVLQHVDDDRLALAELHRVLRPGGWALLQSAVDPARATTVERRAEEATPDSGRYEEALLRAYGRDYADRLERAGFQVTVAKFVAELNGDTGRELGLDPDETIFFCRKPRPAVAGPS